MHGARALTRPQPWHPASGFVVRFVIIPAPADMSLAPGTRLGPYEIVSLLGAGGMGEVYRARDTQLNRDVALKILPDSFAADPERLARFKREAQLLASLNHPQHRARSTASRTSDGVQALVLELVEGPTLADRIARGRDSARRGAADRAADRRGARSRARARHHPSRSEAGEHQGAARRHGQGARLRPGEGARREPMQRIASDAARVADASPRRR